MTYVIRDKKDGMYYRQVVDGCGQYDAWVNKETELFDKFQHKSDAETIAQMLRSKNNVECEVITFKKL